MKTIDEAKWLTHVGTGAVSAVSDGPPRQSVTQDRLAPVRFGRTARTNHADLPRVLTPPAEVAPSEKVALVATLRPDKALHLPPTHRSLNSVAFSALARALWLAAKDRTDSIRRLLVPHKTNLAPDGTGLAFGLTEVAGCGVQSVSWDPEPVTRFAVEAFGPRATAKTAPSASLRPSGSARPWPTDRCWPGTFSNRRARTASPRKTLRRAAKELGIKPIKSDFSGGWIWPQRPESREAGQDSEDGRAKKVTIFADGGHLRAPKGPCRQEEVNAN